MKKTIYLIAILCMSNQLFGQCFPDRHNTSWFDGWISCEKKENPNNREVENHWISYDFGRTYELGELKIWNFNDPDLLSYGAKNINIDYSIDGINWETFGEETIPMASGKNNYEGEVITNLNELKARYLLITILENYGGECTGFAEFRVAAKPSEDESEDICIIADVYPNPFKNEFSVFLEKKCLGQAYFAIEDAMGRTVMNEQNIQLGETIIVNGEQLVSGVYFICLRNGDIKERYKIVKF